MERRDCATGVQAYWRCEAVVQYSSEIIALVKFENIPPVQSKL